MPSPRRSIPRSAPFAAGTLSVAAAATILVAAAVGALSAGPGSALAPQPQLYAAAMDRGVHVVDYGAPAAPASVGDSQRAVPSEDAAASGNVVYVAAGAKGIGIFDMRDPKVPFLYQTIQTPRFAATRLVVDGRRLYALDPAAGARIFDITDPYDPGLKGAFHEAGQIWTGVAASGQYMVLLGAKRLLTVDVSDPGFGKALGEIARGGTDVVLRAGLAYVSDEAELGIVNVRRPAAPIVVAGEPYPQGAKLTGPRIHLALGKGRSWAFVGGGLNGVDVGGVFTFDVAKPTAPASIDLFRFSAPVRSLASDGEALADDGPLGAGELVFVGTSKGLSTVAVLDAAPDKAQVLGSAVALADAEVRGVVVDPREREQATPTAVIHEQGQACVDAEADAWVSVNTRGVNHGSEPDLFVSAGGQDQALSYIRFKLGFVPADAAVVTASLEAELIQQQGGATPILQSVVDASDAAWDEATITFLNRPAHSGRYASPSIDAKAGRKLFDVTTLADAWHTGARPNHGLVLWSENTATSPIESRFGSRENTRTAPPRLCIGWTRDVTPTPGPTETATVPASQTPTPVDTLTPVPSRTPAPSATPSTEPSATTGPSPTGEGELPTVTPRPTVDATRGPTRTALPTAAPTARPSALPTAKPAGSGFRRPDAGAPLPLRRIRRLRFGPDGELWARVPDPSGGPDIVLTRVAGRWRRWGTVEQVIEQRFSELLGKGVVPDFFAADARGRIWAGPNLYDGRAWRRLATDQIHPGGTLRHDQRTLLDRAGRAWVPFGGTTECASPLGCAAAGVRAFDADSGAGASVDVDVVPEMGEYGLEDLHFVRGQAGSGPPTLSSSATATASRNDALGRLGRWLGLVRPRVARPSSTASTSSAASMLAADDVYVVSPSALYVLPDTITAIRYPFLPGIEDAGGETRNAGYATTSAMDLSGRLVAFTWVERHEGRTLSYQIVANTWLGTGWDTPLDLTPGSPLLIAGSAEFLRISAAAFAPDGTLWLGTSDAQVASLKEGVWTHHFTAANSPLIAGEPIQALTVAADGTLWIAQASGMLTYGGSGLVETPTIYLPRAEKK